MSTGVVTIISITVSAVITLLIAKWQMSRKKIVHFFINSYDIGKGLSLEFPEFRLTFNGKELSDNVCVIKGGLMNVGVKDIDGLKGNSDITMNLPQGCTVKALKVVPSNEKLRIKTEFCANTINFGINELLVSDEYLEYTAIVENIDNPHDIKFNHRIKDTKKEIENNYIGPDIIEKKSGIMSYLTKILIILGVSSCFLWLDFYEKGGLYYLISSMFLSILFVFVLYYVIIEEKDKRHVLKVLKRAKKEDSRINQ